MTDRERIQAAFSHLHASPEDLTEVMKMTRENRTRMKLATRRIVTTGLAAVMLLGTGIAGYAIGNSFHNRQQEQLRAQYHVEENPTNDFTEFALSEEASDGRGMTLLSSFHTGDDLKVYVDVSPVEPEEVENCFRFDSQLSDEGWRFLSYDFDIDGVHPIYGTAQIYSPDSEYAVERERVEETEEDVRQRYLREAYDAETKSLTLLCHLFTEDLPEDGSIELHVYSSDNFVPNSETYECISEIHHDFGTVSVPITSPEVKTLLFSEPKALKDETGTMQAEITGIELSSGSISWLANIQDAESIFGRFEGDDTELAAYQQTKIEWIYFLRDATADAELIFADGHTVACGGINGEHDAENGSVHLVRNLPDNVNIHDVKAISIFGETYCFDEADGK